MRNPWKTLTPTGQFVASVMLFIVAASLLALVNGCEDETNIFVDTPPAGRDTTLCMVVVIEADTTHTFIVDDVMIACIENVLADPPHGRPLVEAITACLPAQ